MTQPITTLDALESALDPFRQTGTSSASAVHELLDDIMGSEGLSPESDEAAVRDCISIMTGTLTGLIEDAKFALTVLGAPATELMEEQRAWALGCVRFAQRYMRDSRIIPAYAACRLERNIFCDASGNGPIVPEDLDAVAVALGGAEAESDVETPEHEDTGV